METKIKRKESKDGETQREAKCPCFSLRLSAFAFFALKSLLLGIVCVGCTVGPKYEQPVMDIPCDWTKDIADGLDSDSPDSIVWWESLNDPVLNSLIEQAAVQNLDLSIASMRIFEARILLKGERQMHIHI